MLFLNTEIRYNNKWSVNEYPVHGIILVYQNSERKR